MDIIERLQQIITHEQLNVSSFARQIGVGDQTIRGIVVQRRNKPGFDILVKIIQTFPWLNAEWLLTGNGEMVRKETTVPASNLPSLAELVEYLREKDQKIEKLIEEKTELKIRFEMEMEKAMRNERNNLLSR